MLGILAAHDVIGGGGGGGSTGAAAYAAAVLANSPLGYWRQGEASGGTMTDSSGNSRPGVYNSATPGATGLISGETSVDYNGTSSNAFVTNAAWMTVNTFTIEAIIQPDNVNVSNCGLINRDANGTVGPWWFRINNGHMEFIVWTGGSSSATIVTGTKTISVGGIYHVAMTYDGANMKIYTNGVLDNSGAKTGTPNSTGEGILMGAWFQNLSHVTGFNYDGRLDEVAFYGTALTSTDITNHFNATGLSTIDDTFTGTSLDPAWTRHSVASGAETWLSPGLQDSSLGTGYGYLRNPPAGLSDFQVTVDMTTPGMSAMRGPWIIDTATGNGVGACWYSGSAAALVCSISGYSYGGTAQGIGFGNASGQIRLTKTGTSYTCAYSLDNGVTWTVESPALTWAGTPTAVGMGNWLGSTGNTTTWNRFRSGAIAAPTPTPATTWDFRGLSALPTGWRRIVIGSESFDAAGMSATYASGSAHAVQLSTPVTSGMIEAKMVSGPTSSNMIGPVLMASGSQGSQTAWYSAPVGALALSSNASYNYSSTSANAGGSPTYPAWFRVRILAGVAYSSFSTNGTTWSSEVSITLGAGIAKINEIGLGSIFGGSTAAKWESVKWMPNTAIATAAGLATSSGGTTTTVNMPSGSAVGDLVVITVGSRWGYTTLPSGWTVADANDGSFFNGRTLWKVLNSSDVSAGSVAIVTSGAPWTGATAVRITGVTATPTVAVRSTQRFGGGGSSLIAAQPSNSFSAAYGSLLLYAGINDSTTAMTISRGAQAGSADTSTNIVAHANTEITTAPLSSVTATFNSAASTSAYYTVLEITP